MNATDRFVATTAHADEDGAIGPTLRRGRWRLNKQDPRMWRET